MKPQRMLATLAIMLLAGVLSAQDGPQKGRIKKIDADKSTLVVTSDGKDLTFKVTPDTRAMTADGQPIDNLFKEKGFAIGAAVLFKADGQTLLGIKLEGAGAGKQPKGGPQPAKVVKVDLDKLTVTLKAGDKEFQAIAHDDTKFFGAQGNSLKEKLATFKSGADCLFVIESKDGKNYLVGLAHAQGKKDPDKKGPPLVKVDSSKLVPFNELGNKDYKDGFKGGFYPDGKNERPKAHEDAGLRMARSIQPLNAEGKPDPKGKIVLMSVGMSNTSQASQGFEKVLRTSDGINPQFVFINGAQGGMTAARIQDPANADGTKYWGEVDNRLTKAGLSREQVQVIWIKQADAGPGSNKTRGGFPAYAKDLEAELANIVRIFPKRFPNAKLVYLSSRTYGGYATSPLNPEPYAYESAFSVKWLIERQIKGEADLNFDPKKGDVKAPWLSWGQYLWANGSTKRVDGFSYEREDFSGDGTHHSPAGSEKIGRLMVQFFRSDTTARPWFTK